MAPMAVITLNAPFVAQAIFLSATVGSGCGPTAYVKMRTSLVSGSEVALEYSRITSSGYCVPPSLNNMIKRWQFDPDCQQVILHWRTTSILVHLSELPESSVRPFQSF